jgi:hypothetical protein
LPSGWKRRGDDVFCGSCWRSRFILRAITMPISSPLDCSWDDLHAAVKEMWRVTTRASNWMMTELYARDVRRNGDDKMPPMPKAYLYPEARERFPSLPSRTVASLEHATQGRYRKARYEVIWTCSRSLPTHRYPVPFPMPSQAWHATIEEDRPVVSVTIGTSRLRLRLKSGPQFRRQLNAFRQMARGEAERGDLAILESGDSLAVKMVAWLPRTETVHDANGALFVYTRNDCLLCAVNGKDETLWRYNGDHLRRWQAEHRRRLQRWSEDQKYENRPVPSFAERRSAAVEKHGNRMNSALHEIAAQLAGYAARRRFASVRYDDTEHGFCESFPWYRLRALIAEKLDKRGIAMEIASREVTKETAEPLEA